MIFSLLKDTFFIVTLSSVAKLNPHDNYLLKTLLALT